VLHTRIDGVEQQVDPLGLEPVGFGGEPFEHGQRRAVGGHVLEPFAVGDVQGLEFKGLPFGPAEEGQEAGEVGGEALGRGGLELGE
jgi:hypothetical protein